MTFITFQRDFAQNCRYSDLILLLIAGGTLVKGWFAESVNDRLFAFCASRYAVMTVMAVHVTSAREGLLLVSALLGVIGVILIVLNPAKPLVERVSVAVL